MTTTTCPVCDTENPSWYWTDHHGIAQCECGTPFVLYHYENGKRVERDPAFHVKREWIPILRMFREETGCVIPSGCSVPGGQERASEVDMHAWNRWCDANASAIEERNNGGNET